jgi:glycosyltransferase involved in cell wall biosynthesis
MSRIQRLHKHVLDFRHDLKVLRVARECSYDVIQVKDKVLAALPALWAARRHGAAFVYWLSFPHPEASTYVAQIGAARYPMLYRIRGWFLFRLLYRFILPRADHIFVQSEQMKSDLVGYGLPASRMTPVPMGIRTEDFRGVVDETTVKAGRAATIGYLGTLAGERRIDFLVRCLAAILRERPDARLLLVGAGNQASDEEQIRSEARRLKILDRVEITGFLPRKEALHRVMEAAVCVSPFYPTPILNSTSPTKLIEYMALGRPVVANDHPEQRLVLEQSQAGLCVPYEEGAFAAAILRLLNHPDEAKAMGRRGRDYAEAHRDYRRIADSVALEYRNIAAQAAHPRRRDMSNRKRESPG